MRHQSIAGDAVGYARVFTEIGRDVAEADSESFAEADSRRRLVINLPYDRVRAVLWAITIAVAALGIFREGWLALYGNDSALGRLPLINLDSENALGEWWSVLQLTLAAILVAINGMAEPSRRWKPYGSCSPGCLCFCPSMNLPRCMNM